MVDKPNLQARLKNIIEIDWMATTEERLKMAVDATKKKIYNSDKTMVEYLIANLEELKKRRGQTKQKLNFHFDARKESEKTMYQFIYDMRKAYKELGGVKKTKEEIIAIAGLSSQKRSRAMRFSNLKDDLDKIPGFEWPSYSRMLTLETR